MKVLFLGDIVGKVGRRTVENNLEKLVKKYQVDFVIANGENVTHGKGLIKKHYEEENKYIGKYDNFTELQNHDLTNWLNKEIFQRTIYKADTAYRSYFELLKYQKNNNLEITAKEPDYINGYFPITFSYIGNKYENGKRVFNIPLSVPFKRFLREMAPDINYLKQYVDVKKIELPDEYFIKLSIPRILTNKKIKEISIIPLYNGKKFEIAYTYLDEKE